MVICKDIKHMQKFDKSVLTIGTLDGMHRGHIEVISYLKAVSKSNNVPSVVITFDPHPRDVLAQSTEQSIRCLLSNNKKLEHINNYASLCYAHREFDECWKYYRYNLLNQSCRQPS